MKRALFATLLLVSAFAVRAADGPPFDFRADLEQVHGDVVVSPSFLQWSEAHTLGRWAESPRDEKGRRTIILQEMGPVKSSAILGIEVPGAVFHREFSGAEVENSYNSAKAALVARHVTAEEIETAMPVLDLRATPALKWSFEVAGRDSREFIVSPDGTAVVVVPPAVPVESHACTPGVDDALSQDDLHHSRGGSEVSKVLAMIRDVREVHDSAIRLCHAVFDDVRYSMYRLTDLYTDSDSLTRGRRFGMCDEKSVVLVSYLRTIGIPARLKFLRWMRDGKEQAHACIEYYNKDDATWYHLDPTWDVIHDPTVYRKRLVQGSYPTDIKVVDVDWPSDARSSTDIGNYPDRDGDGRLNPWNDFCYSPSKEGDPARPGYSKD